jgi:hypothetical protein
MSLDYLNIGSSPCDEGCAQVGHPVYISIARIECRIYAAQLSREFPNGDFRVKSFPHDFGTYYEVVAFYDDDGDDPRMEAAFDAEGSANPQWDELSIANLRDAYVGDWVWTKAGWQLDPLAKVLAVTGQRNAPENAETERLRDMRQGPTDHDGVMSSADVAYFENRG